MRRRKKRKKNDYISYGIRSVRDISPSHDLNKAQYWTNLRGVGTKARGRSRKIRQDGAERVWTSLVTGGRLAAKDARGSGFVTSKRRGLGVDITPRSKTPANTNGTAGILLRRADDDL